MLILCLLAKFLLPQHYLKVPEHRLQKVKNWKIKGLLSVALRLIAFDLQAFKGSLESAFQLSNLQNDLMPISFCMKGILEGGPVEGALCICDVRDVGSAHILAAETPSASGR